MEIVSELPGIPEFLTHLPWFMSQRFNKGSATTHAGGFAQPDLREGNLLLVCRSCLNHEAMGPVNHRRWYSSSFEQGVLLPTTISLFESRSF